MLKKSFLSVFVVLLLLANLRCTSDVPSPLQPSASTTEVVSINEVPGLLNAIAPYVNPALTDRGNISSANQGDTYFGMDIDFEEIMARMDSLGYTNYAMRLEYYDTDPNSFTNLVIGKDEFGQFRTPFLITYEMTPEFAQQYYQTGSLEGFSGLIRRAQLLPITGPTETFNRSRGSSEDDDDPDDYGSDRDQPNTTCETVTPVGTGGGAGGDTGGDYVCEVFITTVYSTDGHGNRYIWDQYFTYENCRWEAAQSSAGSTGCETPTGEIPINDPEPTTVLKESIDMTELDSCLQEIISNVLNNPDVNNKLEEILQSIASQGSAFNWKLKQGSTTGNAITLHKYDTASSSVTTIFNYENLKGASELGIARVFMHEAIHAYFIGLSKTDRESFDREFGHVLDEYYSQIFGRDANNYHHNDMTQRWIASLGASLMEYGAIRGLNLQPQFYEHLAWGGLTHIIRPSGAKITAPWFEDKFPRSIERDRIVNLIQIESTGKDVYGTDQEQKGGATNCQ